MSQLRFDDRVVIITGGGRGLARGYALYLAARGANLLINDLGAATNGDGLDAGPTSDVTQ